jgi:hypothetical protein
VYMTSMKSIYKACVLSGPGTIDRFVVFCGSTDADNDLTLLDPHTKKPVFSEVERTAIENKNTQVVFSSQQIHSDDTISSIKYKIASELDRALRIEEIYLFCLRSEAHAPDEFYRALTQNKRSRLTRARMRNALNNFKSQGLQSHAGATLTEEKDVYRYEDVVKLEVIDGGVEVNTTHMMGQRLFLMNTPFPTSFNPFDDLMHDKMLVSAAANAMTTTNGELLLDSGTILDGTIYVCLATDVLDNAVVMDNTERVSAKIQDKYLLTVYFPLLAAQNMFSKAEIEAAQGRSKFNAEGGAFDAFAHEDLLHRVHRDMGDVNTAPFAWDRRGIAEIKIAIHQRFTLKVPLDVIFKLVPTHPGAPLTKLNPGGHRENMYRIYGDTMSTDGRKIPVLSRTTIQHLVVNMGMSKGVSVYFVMDKGDFLTCVFEENGDIIVYGKFATPASIEDVGDLIARHVNPLIKTVEPFFIQSGYRHSDFGSLYDKHVEIVHMDYMSIATTDTDMSSLNIQPIHSCIAPVFVVEIPEIGATGGARMRYRKVSNFDNMTSREAFVIAQLKRHDGFKGAAMIQRIMANYGMTDDEAHELVARVGAEITVDNGIGVHTTKIRSNPGFLVVVSDATEKGLRSVGRISVSVSGIDNMRYVSMIDEYVGALLRLLLDRDATNAQFPTLEAVCATSTDASTDAAVETHIDDVLGAPDRGLMHQQEVIIEDGEVVEADAVPIGYDNVADTQQQSGMTNALDLLYDDESDYNTEEDEEENSQGGGTRNIIGMKLKKPSTFMTAMEEAEPDLFLKAKVGNFDRYSRTCDAAYGRQPVVLTQKEHIEMIAAERTGIIDRYGNDAFYELDADAQAAVIRRETETDDRYTVSYGTSAENQYVYICPRYWCLKTNTFIHPKEMETVVEDGKEVLRHPTCGGVIPRGQDRVRDDGNYVYEFTGDGRKGKGGYAQQHPGFQEENKHPDGYCVPCCFKLNIKNGEVMLSEKQNTRRKQCVIAPPDDEHKEVTPSESKTQPAPRHRNEGHYIMDQNTSPISQGRWAYLDIEIQHFFKEYAVTYQVPNAPTQLLPHVRALLRHGVEPSVTQPFLACMADVMFFGSGEEIKPLAAFREYLANGLALETFVGLQNGNLVTTFADTEVKTLDQLDEVDISEYSDSPLRQQNDEQSKDKDHSFVRLVLAFRRFLSYLRSPNAVIDHTYTWDLVCAKGPHASHSDGINLIILEIPEDDSTTNVNILCPSNHYSTQQFSSNKPSVFVIKRGNTFEPVYSYDRSDTDNGTEYTPYFHTAGTEATAQSTVIAAINNIVKPLHTKRCVPLQSMSRQHVFRHPILLDALLTILEDDAEKNIVIQRQVLNFSRKVVGLEVSIEKISGYIPCYPSGMRSRLTVATTFVDDETLYQSYVDTIFFSELVARTFGSDTIPIRPAYKIVDEEMIIGVLTVADQFVMFSEPIELSTANDEIPVLRQTGRIDAETALRNGVSKRDEERIEHVNNIRLETNFFLAYRNTVRILLNDYANLAQRVEIEERIADAFVPHPKKIETVVALLDRLIGPAVRFDTDMNPTMIRNVSVCINRQPQQCTAANPVCVTDGTEDGDTCTIVIPKTNLVSSNVNNEFVYINKLADQLIRYERIRKYMMDPTQFLSFGQAHYDLGEHEFVVAQTVLKNEYFTDLVARKTGSGEYMGNYDETNPDSRHRMDHPDTFSETDVAAIAAHTPAKLKIRIKI